MEALSISYPFGTNINSSSTFKKFFDYSLFLRAIARLPYPTMARLAFWRGRSIAMKERWAFEAIFANMKASIKGMDDKALFAETQRLFEYASLEEAEGARIGARLGGYLSEWIEIMGMHNLTRALQQGRGAILTFIHMGSFASVLCRIGQRIPQSLYPVAWPYETCPCPVFKGFIRKKVEGISYFLKGRFFFVGEISPRELYSVLEKGNLLVIVIDSPLGMSKKEAFEFLGKTVHFPLSAFKIAAKMSVPIVPIACFRGGDGLRIQADVIGARTVASQDEARLVFQDVLKGFEQYLLRQPSQFFYWTSPTSWRTIRNL